MNKQLPYQEGVFPPQTPYSFLFVYGCYFGRMLPPLFLRYPFLKRWGVLLQQSILSASSSWWVFPLVQTIYLFLFFILVSLTNEKILVLCRILFLEGTIKGGDFLWENLFGFYPIFFPLASFFMMQPLLWISIIVTLTPGCVESGPDQLHQYKILENRVREIGLVVFLSYLALYLILCYDLYVVYRLAMDNVYSYMNAAYQTRMGSLRLIAEAVGVEIDPEGGEDLLLKSIEEGVKDLLLKERRQI